MSASEKNLGDDLNYVSKKQQHCVVLFTSIRKIKSVMQVLDFFSSSIMFSVSKLTMKEIQIAMV